MTSPIPPPNSFSLHYTYRAPRQAVFRAWTDPDALKQWFRPGGHRPIKTQIDLRVGGRFYIEMQTADGRTYDITGEFQVVQPPEKLVLTWLCSLHDYPPTLLTLEFEEDGEGTEVILTHEGFPDEPSMTDFINGWPPALEALDTLLAAM